MFTRRHQLLSASLAIATLVATVGVGQPLVATALTPPSKHFAPPDHVVPPHDATGSADDAGAAPTDTGSGNTGSAGVLSTGLADRLPRLHSSERIPVEILTSTPTADAQLSTIGATATRSIGGLTLASLTATQIRTLGAAAGVTEVRLPVDLRRGLLGAPPRPEKGPTRSENSPTGLPGGAGIKVGIIDLFDPTVLATQIAAGEINPIPGTQRACWWLGQVCPFGTPGYTHGNAVAELVSEGSEYSTLYLAEVGTLTDYMLAIDWFAANGVTILNHSAVGPYDGPGDGTGPTAAVVDYAVSKGIAWFNAAGNAGKDPTYVKFAGGYFRGKWNDSNNNRYMNWYGTDESLSIYCGALMGVRWSDWGADRTDYDLLISDYHYSAKTNGVKVLASAANQAAGAAPIEGNDMRWLCNTNPADGPVYDTDKDGFVSLWLYRTTRNNATPVGDTIEVMVNQGFVEYPSNPGSAAIPFGDSRNPGAASIGASPLYGQAILDFSSRGPTNDGRFKPDFVATGSLTTSLGNFTGTSASSPVAAAIAARGSSFFHLATPALVMSWLRSISVSRLGIPVKNNDEGWGEIVFPTNDSGITGAMGYQAETPHRVLDTRGVGGQPLGAPIGVRPPDSITTVTLSSNVGSGVTFALNVALVNATSTGYLQVYPTGRAAPGATSNINVAAGQTRANFVLVTTGDHGNVSFYTSGGGHIIADVVGSFGSPFGATLKTAAPYNTYDSHTAGGPLAAGSYVDIDLAGTHAAFDPNDGVPVMGALNSPQAVAVSVTVSEGTGGRGYVSVVQPNTTTFSVSNLNFDPGESLTTTTFVPVSAATNGRARIFVSRSAHVRVDVLGYFSPDDHSGGWYQGISPERVLDTRGGTKPLADSTRSVAVAGKFHVPAEGARVVFVNSTSAQSIGTGAIATGAEADDGRFLSTSIPVAGYPVAAGTLARLTTDGQLRLRTTVSSHLIADVQGWFTGPDLPLTAGRTTVVENPSDPLMAVSDLAISDNGQVVAYVEQGSSSPTLHVWNAAVGEVRTLVIQTGITGMRLSGDGSTVAFMSYAGPNLQVFSYRVTDGTLHQESGINTDPNLQIDGLSDNGQLLTYRTTTAITVADTDQLKDVYLHNLVTDGTQLITGSAPANTEVSSSAMTGDGSTVLFTSGVQYQSSSLTRYNVNTGIPSVVWPSSSASSAAHLEDVSDDGNRVVMSFSQSAFVIDLTTGVSTPLNNSKYYEFSFNVHGSIDGAGTHGIGLSSLEGWLDHVPNLNIVDALWIDLATTSARKVNRTYTGLVQNNAVTNVAISDDGNWAVYTTKATNMTPTSTSGPCIYVVDLRTL